MPPSLPTRRLVAVLVVGLLGTACAATTLRSVWQREGYAAGPFHALLVMGISEHAGGRALYEETLARELASHGVRALESGPVLPEPLAVSPERVRRWTRELGVDGVLATHLVRVRRDVEAVPDAWHPMGHPMLWDYGLWIESGLWGHYGMGVGWYTLRESETVVLETNLYDARGQLVWSAVSETFNPTGRDQVVEEVASRVVEELAEHGLIPPASAEGDDVRRPGDAARRSSPPPPST